MSTLAKVASSELTVRIGQLVEALRSPETRLETARQWGRQLAAPLLARQRLLVAGNGGSAAEAQHLTAELVGRYVDDRPPRSSGYSPTSGSREGTTTAGTCQKPHCSRTGAG